MRGFVVIALLLAVALYWALHRSPDPTRLDPYRDSFRLPEEAQRRLWKIEQLAFTLGLSAGPALSQALREGLVEPWSGICLAAASVQLPAGPRQTETQGIISETRWEGSRPATVVEFVEWIAQAREEFARIDRASAHFEMLAPRPEGGYGGSFTLQIVGESRAGGPGEWFVEVEAEYARIPEKPMQEQGWVTRLEVRDAVWRTADHAPFADATETCGIDPSLLADRWGWRGKRDFDPHTSLATICLDYDDDGRLDLLLFHHRPLLYQGLPGGRFRECAEAAGLPVHLEAKFVGGIAGDFDNDGDEDLILDLRQAKRGSNLAFENRGDGTFRPLSAAEFAPVGGGVTNGALADYDGDGLIDLYLPNSGQHPPASEKRERWIGDRSMPRGLLLRNRGGWRFEDVTARAGAGAGYRDIFAANWLDADGDGDADLLLAHHMGENPLLLNQGDGTFREVVSAAGFGGFSMGLCTGDLDGDGDPDGYFANMSSFAGTRILGNLGPEDYPAGAFTLIRGFVQGNVILRNGTQAGSPATFSEAGEQCAGWAYGPAMGDFDGDGRLDLYCPAGYQSVSRVDPDG